MIFGFTILFWVQKDNNISEDENRVLQTLPEFSFDRLISGDYSTDMNDYFADQFPFRNFFINAKSRIELALLKKENNGVVLGDDGQLAVRSSLNRDFDEIEIQNIDQFDKTRLSILLDIEKQFDSKLTAAGIDYCFVMPMRSVDIAQSAMPAGFPNYRSDELLSFVREELRDTHFLDMYDMFREKYDAGEYVYYRTDHHWTTLGAYYCYVEIMKSFGMEPYPLEAFTQEKISDSFYGTTWSKSGFRFVGSDEIYYFHNNEISDDKFTSIVKSNFAEINSFTGFYNHEKLKEKDKYGSFMSGSSTHISITMNNTEGREKILLLKDSFGHSVAPFLALHFDIEMVDLDYLDKGIQIYFNNYNFDKVVVIYNLDNVISNDNLQRLKVNFEK